tara:strand:+ start:504 stop:755 length:252 start_codon:yes stop_codon:yes gene_type:complete
MIIFWDKAQDRNRKVKKKVCKDLNIGDLNQGNTSLQIKRHKIRKKSVIAFELLKYLLKYLHIIKASLSNILYKLQVRCPSFIL